MEKEFIPYEQAVELKELGFDEPCLLHIQYSSGTDVFTGRKFKNSIWLGNGYDAEIGDKKIKYKFPKHSEQGYGTLEIPTYQQVFRWFRDNHRLYHEIKMFGDWDKPQYSYITSGRTMTNPAHMWYYEDKDSYEEAQLECLKKLIEIVKNKS
jgi:hypothetical protein